MKQRPQQIAENLPDDTLMFYHSHFKEDYPKKKHIVKKKDNLIIINLGYYRDVLLGELADHFNKYVMIYSTDFIPYDRLQMYESYGYKIIYEYVDDLNENLSGKEEYKRLKDRHEQLLNDEIITVATSTALYQKIKNSCSCSTLITNGGNYEHFRYKEYPVPEDLRTIKDKFEKTICYYGALASWFDYDLIKRAAEKYNDCAFVLIGLDYDRSLDISGVLGKHNVFYLGKKTYDELPSYGCNVDVFMIPFVINDITLATSPVKLFEYMAMEKPIVTTALPECRKYSSVIYSETSDDFICNIETAFERINDAEYRKTLVKEALENEWSEKSKQLVKFVNRCSFETVSKKIENALSGEYGRIIVWRSTFGWNVPLFQRPQHIASQFAKKGCLVFYEVTRETDPEVFDIKKEKDGLYLVNLQNYKTKLMLKEALAKTCMPKYLQIYSTNWQMSVEELEEYRSDAFNVLYEYIDDISPELAGTETIPEYVSSKYKYVMNDNKTLVVTTAKALYEDVVSKRGTENLVFASNGVDYGFFRDLKEGPELDPSFLKVVNNGRINVCYYGALAKWFDYELIKKIDAAGKYNIILFGVKYDDSYDKSGIAKLKNVHFFGAKEYDTLKYYASKADILTIPFLINSITQATSPLKLFEYMALHKPIVTTAMNECKKYSSVLIAEDRDDFLAKLEKCEKLTNDEEYISLLDREARENDWSAKADAILELLKNNEAKS